MADNGRKNAGYLPSKYFHNLFPDPGQKKAAGILHKNSPL